MARPRTGNKVKNVAMTLNKMNLASAKKHSFKLGFSLSEMVDRLLVAEMTGKSSIARKHNRTMEFAE